MEDTAFQMPAEWADQTGVLMAWPTTASITDEDWPYPGADAEATWKELSTIAEAISQFEPVHIFFRDPSSYTDCGIEQDTRENECGSRALHTLLSHHKTIHLHKTRNTDSLWARDIGPVFVHTASPTPLTNTWHQDDAPGPGFTTLNTSATTVGLLLTFQQWGRTFTASADSYFAFTACQALHLPAYQAPFVGEGGAIEVDGQGTLLVTESSMFNNNRNPGLSKRKLESYFAECLGVEKTLWLPGSRGKDVTDGHVDCLARFTEMPGVVLLSRQQGEEGGKVYEEAKKILENETDALGRKLSIITVEEPDAGAVLGEHVDAEAGPCVSYVNFLIVNGAVIMPSFGDVEKDMEAKHIVTQSFPNRKVVQIPLRQLALQGGGIHCATKHIIR